ncbi:MAG: patatin-like phospholipase family protein [Bacteroidales bacterium]|nr:patatin-like phospholipase family protein [Bacteroidales bacterium]
MGDTSKKKYKTGLVLSGGGTRGFAHLGALKAMEEHGIKPDIIAGVSAGSIVGALYADGEDAEEALKALTSQRLFGFLEFIMPRNSLVKMTGFEKTLRNKLKARKFEDLEIPLIIFAVNINSAELTQFDKGDLVSAIMASSSIPVVFPPVKIGGQYYLDGGIINNFPVDMIREDCETVIGINVNPIGEFENIKSLKSIAERTFHISMRNQEAKKEELCDIYIEPENLDKFGLLDISKAKEIFEIGYKEAIKVLEKQAK